MIKSTTMSLTIVRPTIKSIITTMTKIKNDINNNNSENI